MQVSRACGVQVKQQWCGFSQSSKAGEPGGPWRKSQPEGKRRSVSQLTGMEEKEFSLPVPGALFVLRRCSVDWMIATHMRRGEGDVGT